MMQFPDGTTRWKPHHYLVIGVLVAFGLMILFAASAYQQTEEMIIVVENQSDQPMTEMTLSVVGENQSSLIWEGKLETGESASVKGETLIEGALMLKAIRDGRTFMLGPVGYVAPGLAAHHRFILKADRSVEHMVATGIIPEWRHFQTYDGPHSKPPVFAGSPAVK